MKPGGGFSSFSLPLVFSGGASFFTCLCFFFSGAAYVFGATLVSLFDSGTGGGPMSCLGAYGFGRGRAGAICFGGSLSSYWIANAPATIPIASARSARPSGLRRFGPLRSSSNPLVVVISGVLANGAG